jgi:hypothetical protein
MGTVGGWCANLRGPACGADKIFLKTDAIRVLLVPVKAAGEAAADRSAEGTARRLPDSGTVEYFPRGLRAFA